MKISHRDHFATQYLMSWVFETRNAMWTTDEDSAYEFESKEDAEQVVEWLSEELEMNVTIR